MTDPRDELCIHCGHGFQRMEHGILECVNCHYTVEPDWSVGSLRDLDPPANCWPPDDPDPDDDLGVYGKP